MSGQQSRGTVRKKHTHTQPPVPTETGFPLLCINQLIKWESIIDVTVLRSPGGPGDQAAHQERGQSSPAPCCLWRAGQTSAAGEILHVKL